MSDRGLEQLEDLIAAYRAGVFAGEGAAFATLLLQYPTLQRAVKEATDRLVADIRARGAKTPEEVALLESYEGFHNVNLEFDWFSLLADFVTSRGQTRAISSANLLTRNVVVGQAPLSEQADLVAAWKDVALENLDHLVGKLGDGSTLGEWRRRVVPQMKQLLEDTLFKGLRAGLDLDEIAANVVNAASQMLQCALLLARQEISRAAEEAIFTLLGANEDVIDHWRWSAPKGPRTCAACLLLDGTVYPINVAQMKRHVGCRCLAVPITKNGDLGDRPGGAPAESGALWFERQSAAMQDATLGSKAAGDAYRKGEVGLADFTREVSDPVWGDRIEPDLNLERARQRARDRGLHPTLTSGLSAEDQQELDEFGFIDDVWDTQQGFDRLRGYGLSVATDEWPDAAPVRLATVQSALDAVRRTSRAGQRPAGATILFGTYPGLTDDALAAYDTLHDTVIVNANADLWGPANPDAEVKRMQDGGWHAEGTGQASDLIVHEIGHRQHDMVPSPNGGGIAIADHATGWRYPEKAMVRNEVSAYGSTKPSEAVAEIFVGLVAGTEYSPEVMDVYKKLGGPPVTPPDERTSQ